MNHRKYLRFWFGSRHFHSRPLYHSDYLALPPYATGQASEGVRQGSGPLYPRVPGWLDNLDPLITELLSRDPVAFTTLTGRPLTFHRQPLQIPPSSICKIRLPGRPFNLTDGAARPAQPLRAETLENCRGRMWRESVLVSFEAGHVAQELFPLDDWGVLGPGWMPELCSRDSTPCTELAWLCYWSGQTWYRGGRRSRMESGWTWRSWL